jgi:hypothetical protein
MTTVASVAKAPITQTGMKGFLIWLNREQPAVFNKIAPQLPKTAPKAFGNYLQTQRKLRNIYLGCYQRKLKAAATGKSAGVGGFGDYYSMPGISVYSSSLAPVSVNYSSQLTAPTNYTADLTPLSESVDTGSLSSVSIPPVAAAANTSSISSGTASAIGQIVGAASQVYLTNQQAALQQSAVQANLARAQAGLPPLNTSLNALGVPTISTTASSGTLLLLLGVGAAVLLFAGGSKKAA